ncbi:putative Quercetin 2,3-dioxygenase [Candidatus Accumulibacter aalborgensis]|uniref:Putative Quercetin 2,3-dioxygenase n=1 Tax=Candidatus Accumulibacter aalborgensis TaxID=1860102 RepID=A0A1A8XWA3_9PROT|nr:pirin family protein [Candidatus Accumulibacter aalborgensis]SBT08892.1 putative Quercetin 2,3-dioxygenase [Candidatus Accumulibacter aalborgensis]
MKKLAFIKRSNGSHWVGDGFPVKSIFSYNDIAEEISPFLLMDYAGPADFPPTTRKLGVGQHPHRGFETVTIVYEGGVSHRDSTGGGGTIGPGDVQWMTAASGLIHEEYHSPEFAEQGGAFEMVQLWVNLPAKDKMAAPGYQNLTASQIPEVALPGQVGTVRVIAGRYGDAAGPARTFTPINVWDLRLTAGHRVTLTLPAGHTTALFVLRGAIRLGDRHTVNTAELAVMERDASHLEFAVAEDTTLLLLNGQALNEPVVGYGPFVMNSQAEIAQAIDDFNSGRFGQIGH